ncbi:MAG: DUF4411 family protein [Phenylobacterium sp.]|jgi:hypothetical protein|nr:DUF4411 family protein [Phenylobacterium sp.]
MAEDGEAIYLVDTCVWVNIRDEHADSSQIWDQCFALIEAGRVQTVRQVFDELERKFPDVHARLKPYRKRLVVPDATIYSADAVAEMRGLRAQHPKLYDQLGPGNPADPFLIGAGKVMGAIVVTDERSAGKAHKTKIPYVCTQRNVGWTSRLKFFEAVGVVW